MLFFIGGAARTGKGIVARRLVREMQMPYLSLDVLKMGLARGVPEYVINPNAGGIEVAERMWPLVHEMSINMLMEGINYAFEGELVPKHVAALQRMDPLQIKACFLGYATIAPAQKLHEIRTHAGHPNDWPRDYDNEALLSIINREIVFSQYLKEESAACGMRYFDTSHAFAQTLDEVTEYLGRVGL